MEQGTAYVAIMHYTLLYFPAFYLFIFATYIFIFYFKYDLIAFCLQLLEKIFRQNVLNSF